VSFLFQLELNTVEVLNVTAGRNLMDWLKTLKGSLLMCNDMKFSPFLCGELTAQGCANINLQPTYIVFYLCAENIVKNPIV
jgi:hypothetical protein